MSQLEGDIPPAGGNILSMPEVHLAAEIKHQGLDTNAHIYTRDQLLKLSREDIDKKQQRSPEETSDLGGAQEGDAGDGGPGLLMRHQSVLQQPVHTVRLHHSSLIELVLLFCTGSCGKKQRATHAVQFI